MTASSDHHEQPKELQLKEWIDQLADSFEVAWNESPPARLSDFLGDAAGERRYSLLLELVRIDLEYRYASGEPRSLEEYVSEFPELAGPDGTLPDDLVLFARDLGRRLDQDASLIDTVNSLASGLTDFSARIQCPNCGNSVDVEKTDGEKVACPHCGEACQLAPAAADAASLQLPRTLGKFQLLEILGSGSFGTVYKARDAELARLVALKLPRATAFSSADEEQRFLTEARSAARLAHPNIVPVHEIAHERDLTYIVSEYIEGETLADRIERQSVSHRRAAQWVAEVADALHYAHSQKVVHRDVKPSNILIDTEDRPHVTDFGLARDTAGEVGVTVEGQIVGTPAYMSPEQAAAESAAVDARSDVYSLGVVLYELLTGERPFRGNARMLLHQVLNDEPRPPRRLNDRIPRDLETICLKAMAKSPGRRFVDAAELGADLRRYLDGRPIHARPVGSGERFWQWCRRNPALAVASALAIGALVCIALLSTLFGVQQSKARREIARTNTDLNQANVDLKLQRDLIENSLREANRRTADLALYRGLAHSNEGDYERGMHWFVRGLEYAPKDDDQLQWLLRANLAAWRPQLCPSLATMWHVDHATCATFSRDGTLFFAADSMSTGRVWDVESGVMAGPCLQHATHVEAAAFDAQGRLLVTGTERDVLHVWDFRTGEELLPPMPLGDEINAIALTDDGRHIVVGGWKIHVISLDDGKQVTPSINPGEDYIDSLAVSPDGRLISAIIADNRPKLRTWDLKTGQALGPPVKAGKEAFSLAFSPDSKLLVLGMDAEVQLWKAESGKPVSEPFEHYRSYIHAVAFSPDGEHFAAGDGIEVKVWETATHRQLPYELTAQYDVDSIAFSHDGKRLFAGSNHRTVDIWDVASGRRVGPQRVKRPDTEILVTKSIRDAVFTPDGSKVLTARSSLDDDDWHSELQLWSATSGQPLGPALVHPEGEDLRYIAVSPDGELAAVPCSSYAIRIWNLATGKQQSELRTSKSSDGIAFTHDGKALILITADAKGLGLVFLDPASGEENQPAVHLEGGRHPFSFSRDGKQIATGFGYRTARLWDASTGESLGPPLPHHEQVMAVALHPDGRTVLSGSQDETAQLWDGITGEKLGPPLRHSGWVKSVAFTPDGRIAITGGPVPTASARIVGAHMWHVASGQRFGPPLHGRHKATESIAVSSDGSRILTTDFRFARIRQLNPPVAGDVERLRLWVQVETGTEMDDGGRIHVLAPHDWLDRRRHLEELGGPPLP